MRALVLVWLLALTATLAAAEPLPRTALVIDESDPSSGLPTTFSATLRAALSNSRPSVAVFGETLDLNRFAGQNQEAILRTYVQQKYNDVRFGVIVAVGASSLDLVRRWQPELWPDVPIVFAAIDELTAARLAPDRNMTGLVMRRTIDSTMKVARILVPDLQRVVVIGGSLTKDPYRRQYLQELPALAGQIELIDLTGLPLSVQAARTTSLPDRTAIFYTSLFIDDEGTRYSPSDALTAIAKVTNRPILVDVESLVGFGATGGFVLDNVAYGREVAALAVRILGGAGAAANPIAVSEFTKPVFDWRQLERRQVKASSLPAGSEVLFQPPSMWEQHRAEILVACAAFLVQTALIGWLIYEHRRRNLAEIQSRETIAELTYLNRRAAAGELSASIAHEVSQPITAISTTAAAALTWLRRKPPDLAEALASLEDILEASNRVGGIIKSIRAMFKKDTQPGPVDVNRIITTVLEIARIEIQKHKIEVVTELAPLPVLSGDAVQLQQVMSNLIMNAIEAMQSATRRVLRIVSELTDAGAARISIEDTGPGIDASDMKRIFNPMFTTKSAGMGMGLSICRTIIQAHGGRIWAEPRPGGGSMFQIELPVGAAPERVEQSELAST